MKVVFDTNILISGIGWSGRERRLLLLAALDRYELVISNKILEELVGVLQREKFSNLDSQKISRFINLLTRVCLVVIPEKHHEIIENDPDDNMILDCAVEAEAEYIVSGDHHLLDLGDFKDIKIVESASFEEIMNNREEH